MPANTMVAHPVSVPMSAGVVRPASELDLSSGDLARYSLMRAIRACAEQNWRAAPFELECSRTICARVGGSLGPHRFHVPLEVQNRRVGMQPALRSPARTGQVLEGATHRDLNASLPSAGGYLVATAQMSLIEVLRNRSIAYRMGARRLAGLVGNVAVSRQTGAATAAWLGTEVTAIPESQQSLGQLALSPKTVGAYVEVSRQLMLQASPDAEALVTADLGAVCGLAVDVAAIRGPGGAEPLGIANTPGVSKFSAASLDYVGVRRFQKDVGDGNVVPVAGGYVTTTTVADLLMGRVKFAGTASQLWNGNLWDAEMCGFPAMSTNQMAPATMLFGDWDQLVIGEWGLLEIEVNPFANFAAGVISVRAMYSVDVGLRHAVAFSLGTGIN